MERSLKRYNIVKHEGKPKMKVLIIVDMQNDFLIGPLGNEHCKKAIDGVVKLLKSEKWDAVYATRDTHMDNYMKTLEGEKLPVVHCVKGTDGWNLNKDVEVTVIANEQNLVVVDKPTFGSVDLHKEIFTRYANDYGQQAAEMLGRGNDLEFHVCGVCTSICVLANVVLLRACWPDAEIVVHADACGDVTMEMHEAAKICFAAQQCEVVGEKILTNFVPKDA